MNPLHWKINESVRETENPFDFSNKSNLIEGIDYTDVRKTGKTKRRKVFEKQTILKNG